MPTGFSCEAVAKRMDTCSESFRRQMVAVLSSKRHEVMLGKAPPRQVHVRVMGCVLWFTTSALTKAVREEMKHNSVRKASCSLADTCISRPGKYWEYCTVRAILNDLPFTRIKGWASVMAIQPLPSIVIGPIKAPACRPTSFTGRAYPVQAPMSEKTFSSSPRTNAPVGTFLMLMRLMKSV